MEEFVKIDWTPSLDDILDGKFVDVERLQTESSMYKALRGSFNDPFTDLHKDFEDLVTQELIDEAVKQNKEQKKTKDKNKQDKTKDQDKTKKQDAQSVPEDRVYVPGILKSNLHFPTLSALNSDQHALCLGVLLKFSGAAKILGTAAEKKEMKTYMDLKPIISKEQDAFLEFAKSNWDSSQFTIQEEEFINSQWNKKVKAVESLPRYYVEEGNIPLVSSIQVELNFQSNCLEIGTLPKIFFPKLNRRCLSTMRTNKIYERYFSAESDKHREKIIFKVPVSKDPNCDELVKAHDVDLVISSSGLNCLAINMDPNVVMSWILPVVVRRINDKNVVFIDKPLPPTGLNILQKNAWLHKYNMKACLTHPFHIGSVKLNESYEKSEEKQETSSQDEEKDSSSANEEDQVQENQQCKKSKDENNYVPPPTGHNLFYRLFTIGSTNEPQNELMKNRVDKTYKLLVRTKIDGVRKENDDEEYLTIIAPKIEHQLALGAEAVSLEEAAKQWMSLTFRPDTSLVRVRMEATSTEFIQYEKQTAASVKNEITRLYNLKVETVLTLLYNVTDAMTKLNPGNYLLRHTPRNGTFISIHKESEAAGKNVLDLQTIFWSNSFPTIPNPPWPLLDKMVVTPAQKLFQRMPAMFHPPKVTKTYGTKGSRGRGRGRGRGKNAENLRQTNNTASFLEKQKNQIFLARELDMLIAEQYYHTGLLVYVWSKYVWQQILEKRQRNVLNTYKVAPREIRDIVKEEDYENRRIAALHRSTFQVFKSTIDVGLATTFIFFEGFRKIWEKSSEIVFYLNFYDSQNIMKNALFLTLLTSGTFLVSLPFVLLEIHSKETSEKQITVVSTLLDHCVVQTLLFPFVCLFIVGFKLGGDKTMLWAFAFAEFQALNEFLLDAGSTKSLQNDELRNEVAQLTERYNFPLQDVLVDQRVRDEKLVSLRGFPGARTIVLSKELSFSDSSSEHNNLTTDEIKSLVARELSHWDRNHFLIRFLFDQLHLCLRFYTMHRFLNSAGIYKAFEFENRPIAVGLILLQYCPLFDLYNFVARTINRQLEFIADKETKRIHGDTSLKRAIIKIADRRNIFPIEDPLSSACWNSEASCYERINALNQYKFD